jgi:trehalose 6-phosphate phosphatase
MMTPDRVPPLSLADGAALFLDFDGTLVDLADAPDAIVVPEELQPLLARLVRRLEGRVAIVSGRAIQDLDQHLTAPGIALSGSHGLELRRAGGEASPVDIPPALAEARQAVARFAAGRDGLLIEQKPAGVALHFRQAPQREEEAVGFISGVAERTGLAVQRGKMMAELRPAGRNKGHALRSLMAEPPFAGARPLFMGDDITDEDAFRAAAEMGGAGVLVGPPRPTAAKWRLRDVAAVARWLAAAAGG